MIKIRKNSFYIVVDETFDFLGRKLLNILVRTLKEGFYSKPGLNKTIEILDANGEVLSQEIKLLL